MATSQAGFKWTDDKPINLRKCLEELDSSYVKFSFLNIDSFQVEISTLYENLHIISP